MGCHITKGVSDVSRVFEIEYSTYRILNRSELCECSLTTGNYLLSYTNINCGNTPESRDGYFTTYYSFNKIVLDVITEKFDIQVDKNTKTQAALLHNDIPGYDLPTIDFVQTAKDIDEDISILEEDNSQIYAHLDNVLVHMIDNQEAAIFKSKQDFNKNKEKISQYIKYTENWQVASVICSYAAMACDVIYFEFTKRGRDYRQFKRNHSNGICCTGYYDYCMYSSCNYCHVFLLHEMQTYSYHIQILFSIFTDFSYYTYVKTYRSVCRSD